MYDGEYDEASVHGGVQAEGGGAVEDERMLTLDKILPLARDRIVLDLYVKDAIYGDVVDAVYGAGAQDRVIVKTFAGVASGPWACPSGSTRSLRASSPAWAAIPKRGAIPQRSGVDWQIWASA